MPGWFTYPFKALSRTKPASRAMAEASESLMQSSAKMAEKAGELASKDAAGAAKLLEQASKTVQEGKALLNTETISETEKLAKLKRYPIPFLCASWNTWAMRRSWKVTVSFPPLQGCSLIPPKRVKATSISNGKRLLASTTQRKALLSLAWMPSWVMVHTNMPLIP